MFLYISEMTKRHTEGSTDVITKVLASGIYTKSCVSKILHFTAIVVVNNHRLIAIFHTYDDHEVSFYIWFLRTPPTEIVASLSTITLEKGRTSHRIKMHPMLTTFTMAMQTMILCTQAELSTISNLVTLHSLSWTLVVIAPH